MESQEVERPRHRADGLRCWCGRTAAFVFLAVLLGVGCATAPRPADAAKWEKDIRAFEAADRTNPPPSGATLFVGSSTIRLWKTLAQDFPDRPVLNRGFGGSQMSDLLAYMDRIVLPYAPRMILVYEGDNDLAGGRSPKEIADGFEEFARRVHRKLPRTHVAFVAIKPSISRERLMGAAAQANERIARFCASRKWLSYLDVFTPMLSEQGRPRPELFVSDNLHLNEQGYRLWVEIVRPHLATLEGG